MIATIILSILALCYYLFSIFFITVLIEEDLFEKSTSARLGALIGILLIAPIATPIILGIILGITAERKT